MLPITYIIWLAASAVCVSANAQTAVPDDALAAGGNSAAEQLEEVSVVGTVDSLVGLDFYAPNSSDVLQQKDIEAQGAHKLDQAMHYVAGVLGEPFGSDNKVEWFKIRGFDASIALDGTPTTPNGYFVWKQNLFGVESVEVLKGPNSLVFGASESGGVVNLVTKRPHKQKALLLNAEAGSQNRFGVSADYNGLANADGSVYYRLVAQANQEDGMQRETNMKEYYFAPSVTVDYSQRTSLTVLASVQRDSGTPTNGFLPAYGTIIDTPYGRIDRRLNAGEPGVDHLKRTQSSLGWTLRHDISKDWKFTQIYKYSRLNLDQLNVFAYGSDNDRQLQRGYSYTDGSTKTHYIDNRVEGHAKLAEGWKLRPTFGVDYLKTDTGGMNNGFGMAPNLDMFTPNYGAPFAVGATPYALHSKQFAVYGSAELQVGDHWLVNTGWRYDRAKNNGRINDAESDYHVHHNSVSFGAMYLSDTGISPYISYSESYKPIAGVDGRGKAYRPYEGKQTELGVKLQPKWLDGSITLSYFDVKEKNALISDASNIQTQAGQRSNRGFELEADVKLARNSALKAAFTHNRSRQDISTLQTIHTPLVPDNQFSLWLSHRFDLANAQNLTVAGGVRYTGETEDQRYYLGYPIKSFTLLDLMVRYEIDRNWTLQANVRNLTDKKYVSGCDFYCYYGGERAVNVRLNYQWR